MSELNEETVQGLIDTTVAPIVENVNQIINNSNQIAKSYFELISKLEERFETQEAILAQTVAGYAELAANVEAVLTMLASESDEKRVELQKALAIGRSTMMKFLNQNLETNQDLIESFREDFPNPSVPQDESETDKSETEDKDS